MGLFVFCLFVCLFLLMLCFVFCFCFCFCFVCFVLFCFFNAMFYNYKVFRTEICKGHRGILKGTSHTKYPCSFQTTPPSLNIHQDFLPFLCYLPFWSLPRYYMHMVLSSMKIEQSMYSFYTTMSKTWIFSIIRNWKCVCT